MRRSIELEKAQEVYSSGLEANRRGETRAARDLFLQAHTLVPASTWSRERCTGSG